MQHLKSRAADQVSWADFFEGDVAGVKSGGVFGKAAGKTFGAAGFEWARRVAFQNDALLMLANKKQKDRHLVYWLRLFVLVG